MKTPTKKKQSPPHKMRHSSTNQLAMLGYWCNPVQKVVREWVGKIGEDACQHYMLNCFFSMRAGTDGIDVPLRSESHKRYVLEIMLALDKVFNDRKKPDVWLLELFNSGRYAANGRPNLPTYEQLAIRIGGLDRKKEEELKSIQARLPLVSRGKKLELEKEEKELKEELEMVRRGLSRQQFTAEALRKQAGRLRLTSDKNTP